MMDARLFPLPRNALLPDYGSHGLLGLTRALGDWLRGNEELTLPGLSPLRPRGVVLLVIDGLGEAFLQRLGQGSRLHAHRLTRLTSVCPSTTASAVTTLYTGLAPAEHGLTGWFIHDRRFGGVIAPLPLHRRGGGRLRGPFLGARLFPYRTLAQQARRPVSVLTPAELAASGYSARHTRGARVIGYSKLQELLPAILEEAARLEGCGLIHAYYPGFDALSHKLGPYAPAVQGLFGRLDEMFAALASGLRRHGMALLVTADHGFSEAPEERHYRIDARSPAQAMLAAPLSGERRLAFCHLRVGAEQEFEDFAASELAGRAVAVRSRRLLAAGLFGPGQRHARLAERIGNYALLMEAGHTLSDRVPGEDEFRMRGVHGGLSGEEMWIPLIHAGVETEGG
ncbi:phosphodiesterase [Azoarcus indigens]|uniref:Putative AlkP superfamily pyrophosphatase or phosphodiesterase n=1 Tax=Azoarcus indigens TaxID=29545 RepID=A0A4R6EEQ4_9RHOO|nr:alkaline phosphatase family protein [Azoarcus indigens]NMG64133.1 phosphodiesterase [Azoarcus indigens]TDN55728.1 putative AlkP superfamily pyrophosphatase or phosphodiesterase [Azoarcus indigens]